MSKNIYNSDNYISNSSSSDTLTGLSDTIISSPSNDQFLKYSGGNWVNSNITPQNITGLLDGMDKINTSFLPESVLGALHYCGSWDANTNTPTLTSSSGVDGCYYVVNVAGNTVIDGKTDWQIGDWIVYNGTTWDKIDNVDEVNLTLATQLSERNGRLLYSGTAGGLNTLNRFRGEFQVNYPSEEVDLEIHCVNDFFPNRIIAKWTVAGVKAFTSSTWRYVPYDYNSFETNNIGLLVNTTSGNQLTIGFYLIGSDSGTITPEWRIYSRGAHQNITTITVNRLFNLGGIPPSTPYFVKKYNLYEQDGFLSENRTLNLNGNQLNFTNGTISINPVIGSNTEFLTINGSGIIQKQTLGASSDSIVFTFSSNGNMSNANFMGQFGMVGGTYQRAALCAPRNFLTITRMTFTISVGSGSGAGWTATLFKANGLLTSQFSTGFSVSVLGSTTTATVSGSVAMNQGDTFAPYITSVGGATIPYGCITIEAN